jgi:arabinogalactan endo-1,4-beta-galactosidase
MLSACGGASDGPDRQASPGQLPQSSVASPEMGTFARTRDSYWLLASATGITVKDRSGTTADVVVSPAQVLHFSDFTVEPGIGNAARTIAPADLKLLIQLYVAFFNRVPEASGLKYWIEQFRSGTSIDAIGDAFYSAAVQYAPITGYSQTMTNSDFVALVYRNVLGRTGMTAPGSDELGFWAGEIASGRTTRGKLIRQMLASAYSFAGDVTWGWVPQLLDNKYAVSLYFAVQQGLSYTNPEDNITRGALIAGAITPTDTSAAMTLIGVTDSSFDLFHDGDGASEFVLGALVPDSYAAYRWAQPSISNTWKVLETLRASGFGWIRMWTTTHGFNELRQTDDWHALGWKNEYWSCLEMSGAILKAGADAGMRQRAVLFLSDIAANAGNQPRPSAWNGLSTADLQATIETHARQVATYYQSLGLNIEVFEIGNEIEFGICGVTLSATPIPAGVDPVNDPAWMKENLWSKMAPLLTAAIRGVRSVYPSCKICLHIAGFGYSTDDVIAPGFFASMLSLGVPFDVAGFSYPYLIVPEPVVPQPYFRQPKFLNALAAVRNMNLEVDIVEFDYPADPRGILQTPSPEYPLTPDGQAKFIQDLATTVKGTVSSLYYFYPDHYPGLNNDSSPDLGSCGLFDAKDVARPALSVFAGL